MEDGPPPGLSAWKSWLWLSMNSRDGLSSDGAWR